MDRQLAQEIGISSIDTRSTKTVYRKPAAQRGRPRATEIWTGGRSDRDRARKLHRRLTQTGIAKTPTILFCVLVHLVKPSRRAPDEYIKHFTRGLEVTFKGLRCFAYEDSRSTFFFVCLSTTNSTALGGKSVRRRLERFLSNDRKYLSEQFDFAVSEIHHSIDEVVDGYLELSRCLRYIQFYEQHNRLIPYDAVANLQSHFSFPRELAEELTIQAAEGKSQRAQSVIDRIIHRNSYGLKMTVETGIFMVMTLLSTIRRVAFNSAQDEDYANSLHSAEHLLSCTTFADMIRLLRGTLNKVCTYVKRKRGQKHLLLSRHVIEYIETNYFDPSLDVNSLGRKFNLTPAYLSRVFKAQTGCAITYYIRLTRANKAKVLLEDRLKLSSVANRVGFGSVITLIRAFSSIQGITPGQYKKQAHAAQQLAP